VKASCPENEGAPGGVAVRPKRTAGGKRPSPCSLSAPHEATIDRHSTSDSCCRPREEIEIQRSGIQRVDYALIARLCELVQGACALPAIRIRKPGDRRQVDQHEAAIVRQIFAWYLEVGTSLYGVSKRLADAGIAAPRGRAHWTGGSVRGILQNPAYVGTASGNRFVNLLGHRAVLPEGSPPFLQGRPIRCSAGWGTV
jgi:hypothetical protein